MIIPGTRLDFEESWLKLYEMPQGIGAMNIYQSLVHMLKERISFGTKIIDCGNGLYKTDSGKIINYWIGTEKDYLIIAELTITSQSTVINAVAKKNAGAAPSATDLYIAILNDIDNSGNPSLRFQSDTLLTQDGLKVWKRLIDQGYAVTVYDNQKPGQSMQSLQNSDELLDFFKMNDKTYGRYQYVLSKPGIHLGEVRSFFNLRRMRELTGSL